MAKDGTSARGPARGRAKAPPPAKPVLPAEGQVDWALAACARVMRPLVRLALHLGVKHAQLDSLLRGLLVEEALRAWRVKGVEANLSQLSLATGLHRKAVTSMVRDTVERLPSSEMSAPARTLTQWLRLCTDDPSRRKLPINAGGPGPSFESVAHEASRGNVHHRAVLDELVRLGMVSESNGFAALEADGFVPARDLRGMLAFLGDNARDHLLAGVSNTEGASHPAFLERSVFAKGITAEDCERIHQIARTRWNALHHELAREFTSACADAPKEASARMRIGIYAYYEESPPPAPQAEPAAPGARTRRRP